MSNHDFVLCALCGGSSWVATVYFLNRVWRAWRKIFERINLSRPPDQQFRYFDVQPRQRFQLVRIYRDAYGENDELLREWSSDRNWAFAFFILGFCFIALAGGV